MRILELSPDQIITLNDYPVHSDSVLSDYFKRCKLGEELPFVPVIRQETVRIYLDDNLLTRFEKFTGENPEAQYFMLDGSHRTTAVTLTGHKIRAIIYEKDEDIIEAKKLVATGQVREDDILDHTLEENCKILNRHFREKPYFMTVEQKTQKMVREMILPQCMIDSYTKRS